MRKQQQFISTISVMLFCASASADDNLEEILARGKELYFERVSCWVCHGDSAEGRIGPSMQYGPTPMVMQEQLDSNPQMEVIVTELNPDAEDLISLATFIASFGDCNIHVLPGHSSHELL